MRQAAFRARPKRRQPPKDQGTRSVIAAKVLEREFEADGLLLVLDFDQFESLQTGKDNHIEVKFPRFHNHGIKNLQAVASYEHPR